MSLSPSCSKYTRCCSRNQWLRDATRETHSSAISSQKLEITLPYPPNSLSLEYWASKLACWRHSRDKVAERFQGALRLRRVGRNTRSSKFRWPRMFVLQSRLLAYVRQVSPPALRPGHVELFLLSTRAIFQPLWGLLRAERGECLSTSLSRSRPLCLETKFTTDVAGSLLGARRCDIKARPTCPSRGPVRLVRGGNVERLEHDCVRRTVAKVHHDGRRSSRRNKRQCDLGRHVHGEPMDVPKMICFMRPR